MILKGQYRYLLLACGVAFSILLGCWFFFGGNNQAVFPVVFVHGLGGTGNDWSGYGYFASSPTGRQFSFVADLAVKDGQVELPDSGNWGRIYADYPCFTISISRSGTGPIPESARELASVIRFIRYKCRVDKVILVGYSLGGVICREYVTSAYYDHDVAHIITVSSPHLGSEYAYISDIRARMLSLANGGDTLLARLAAQSGAHLESLCREVGIDIGSEALAMLKPPENGNYLDTLNRRPHPRDIRYSCVIANKSLVRTNLGELAEDLSKVHPTDTALFAVVADGIRQLFAVMQGNNATSSGDGYVSERSQNLQNVYFFLRHPEIPIDTEIVSASHPQQEKHRDLVELLVLRGSES